MAHRHELLPWVISAVALIALASSLGRVPAARAATADAAQLAAEVASLRARIQQLEARAATPPPSTTIGSERSLSALAQDIATIKQVLQITAGGVTLKTPGTLMLQAGGAATVDAGGMVKVRAGSTAQVEAGSELELKGGAKTSVRGGQVVLNQGNRPIAFKGAAVSGSAVSEGTATVLVP